jgi:hypothetical protein
VTLLRSLAKAILPEPAFRRLVFSRIYKRNYWGKDDERFHSGVGSRGKPVDVYVDAVAREVGNPGTIVDLGCGDFVVGRELLKRFPDATYIGCDIVPALVRHNERTHGNARVSFRLLDAVSGTIPAGDVHLVRQVFQHLSNAEILTALHKLKDSPCLLVTEGQPLVRTGPVNPDKPAGQHARFDMGNGTGGGIELDKPPFNKRIRELCRAETPGSEHIVTWRVT